MSVGKKWRDFKTKIKKCNYDPYKTYQERIAHRDDRVAPNEWEYLIKYWSSEVGQVKLFILEIYYKLNSKHYTIPMNYGRSVVPKTKLVGQSKQLHILQEQRVSQEFEQR